jgi:hypothetical protein
VGSIIVLGPSRWLASAKRRATPLATRQNIVRLLQERGIQATLVEKHEKAPDEDDFNLFQRVLRENEVRTFLIYWPLGARLHGLDVEIGHLLTRMEEGSLHSEDIYLLVEATALPVDPGKGAIAWSEPGNRTRYHAALIARGC